MADGNSTAGAGSRGSQRPEGQDPYGAFRFSVRIDGAGSPGTTASGGGSGNGSVLAGFSDVSGLAVETEVESFRAGGVNAYDMQLAGATKFSSRLVLKRGLTRDLALWNWYRKVLVGEIVRRNVTVLIRSTRGEPGLSWVFVEACPVKWVGPDLHAAQSAIAFDSIELVHRGLLLH